VTIIEVDTDPPAPPSSTPTWTSDITGGQTWLGNLTSPGARMAWTQVLAPGKEFDAPMVGVSGRVIRFESAAVSPDGEDSESDFPFHHPFATTHNGNEALVDWEVAVEVDSRFITLLGPTNDGHSGADPMSEKDFGQATAKAASAPKTSAHAGVLGVEFDAAFVPEWARPGEGDRVAVIGRWIVDAGHDDFHTEIHPPFLLAGARPVAGSTISTLVGRPYLVSQLWPEGSFRDHILAEAGKVIAVPPLSELMEARAAVFTTPFEGPVDISYLLRPPGPPPYPGAPLDVRANLVVRNGVKINITREHFDTVRVRVRIDPSAYDPADLPPKHEIRVQIHDLLIQGSVGWAGTLLDVLDATLLLSGLAVIPAANWAIVNAKGVAGDVYRLPAEWEPVLDPAHERELLPAQLNQGSPVPAVGSVVQPFPFYGTIKVGWEPPLQPGSQQRVFYLGSDQHVHVLRWQADGGWHASDITGQAAGGAAAAVAPSSPLTGYVMPGSQQHAFYLGTDNHVHELWSDVNGWHANDISAAASGPAASVPAPSSRLIGLVLGANQLVYYVGVDQHVHELWWTASGGWLASDISAAGSGAAPAALSSPLTGYAVGSGPHYVFYLGTDQHVHELWWNSSGWHAFDVTAASAGTPVAAPSSPLTSYALGTDQHVFYLVADQHVHELWWSPNHGWVPADITAASAGTPVAAPSSPLTSYALGTDQHVFYLGADQHVHELWWSPNHGWVPADITAASAGAPDAAMPSPVTSYQFTAP
jgi:hypothetical protein